jgi:hypothetical protein
MASNYINRQKFVYPEISDKPGQCRQIQDCFNRVVAGVE